MNEYRDWYLEHEKENIDDFFSFLRFKSVSTEPKHKEELVACANWVVSYLQEMGFTVKILTTSSHPVIYAEYITSKEAPTLLLYHHYDVQPADPYELWNSDPFDPKIVGGEVYARGAQDNKGQCFYSLMAVKAFLKKGKKPHLNIKFCIEGDEECGSVGLYEVCNEQSELFSADYLLIVDSGIMSKDTPSLAMGMRGISTFEVKLTVADIDLHSGVHGGLVYNPLRALSEILSGIWDENGSITIPHFYDQVDSISPEEKRVYDHPFDEKEYRKSFGIRTMSVEKGFSPSAAVSMRPTVEINGMFGGYTGSGFKTVLPKEATAKISCRLVPHQDPQVIYELIKKYIQSKAPHGMQLDFHYHGGGVAFRAKIEAPIVKIAKKAYEEVFGKPCLFALTGGSIPVTAALAKASKAETVSLGMGLDDDNIHAPNEHFGLDRLQKGYMIMVNILHELSQ